MRHPLKSEKVGSDGESKLWVTRCFSFLLQAFVYTFSKALQAEYKAKGIIIQVRLTILSLWEWELWIPTELGPRPPAGPAMHTQPGEGVLDDTMGVLATLTVSAVLPWFPLLLPSPTPWVLEQVVGQGK